MTEWKKPDEEIKLQGVGVLRAHEAINYLKRIPKKDGLRARGFQIVEDWIAYNEGDEPTKTRGDDASAVQRGAKALKMFTGESPAVNVQRPESQNTVKTEVLPVRPAKLSNAEKREAVQAALADDPAQADRELARRLGVSHTYVAKLRAELNGNVAKVRNTNLGNVAKGDNVTLGNVSTVEERRNLFVNLGAMLADEDAQWLREACEMLLATLPTTKPKKTAKKRGAK